MDQKRFLPFFAISMLIFFGWAMLARSLFPPEELPPEEVAQVEGEAPEDEAAEDDPAEGNQPTEPTEENPDSANEPAAEAEPDESPAIAAPAPAVNPEWFTLGSMKPGDPYQLAITLNNKGASVENAELVTRNAKGAFRYRDLDDDSGYLGYLALTEATGGGCKVEAVIPGSPAALAGLKQGDLLLSINQESLAEPYMLRAWLNANKKNQAKPGQKVTLAIQRGGKPLSLTATLTRKPLSVISPEHQLQADGTLYEHQHAFLLSLEQLGTALPKRGETEIAGLASLRKQHWQGKKIQAGGAEGVEFSTTLSNTGKGDNATGLEIIKRYWLKPRASLEEDGAEEASPGYDFTLELEFRNTSDTPTQLAYRLDGPTGLPKEGWWYANKIHPHHFFNALGARDVIWSSPATGSLYMGTTAIVKQAEDEDSPKLSTLFAPPQAAPFRYVGIDAQYFSCVMLPTEADPEQPSDSAPVLLDDAYAFPVTDLSLVKEDKGRFKKSNVTFRLNSAVHELGANESFKQHFTVFTGPKDPEILAQYQLDDIISYGWFGIISKPLLKLLHGLYWITGSFSYGLAIILLTLIVRSCLMPLGLKAARSAKKMQELAPEIKKLKEKYPDNLEKQWAAQQELLKKNNASQFGGCLPMFLQLPIFLGLYRGLATDIQLRQAPLLPGLEWCTNLAGPDKLFYWEPYLWESLGGEMGWLGPYFNLLPVITVMLFYLHQKLFTPPATDDQQKQMQQVMSFMMIFFCVMFFKVPAGLCLYFITSSLWGLGERLFLKKDAKKNETTDLAVPAANQAKLDKAKVEKIERRKELARKQQKKQ